MLLMLLMLLMQNLTSSHYNEPYSDWLMVRDVKYNNNFVYIVCILSEKLKVSFFSCRVCPVKYNLTFMCCVIRSCILSGYFVA